MIRVSCVCPGDVITPMLEEEKVKAPDGEKYLKNLISHYPGGKLATPEEIAAVISFLASETAPFVLGSAWSIDGGITAYGY